MESFATKVRTFDAFPKVDAEHTVRSSRGGFSTLITIICGLLILWVEVGGFLGGYVDHQFAIDDKIKSDLSLNIDMLVAMPCEFLHTNVMDITDDRFLAGELLNFEGTNFFLPQHFEINSKNSDHDTPDLDHVMQETMRAEFRVAGARVNEGAPACHIFGSIPVNQVKGDFHITGKGFGYSDGRLVVPYEALNFTHVISEFSYGDFYPFINNPLDFTGKVTEQKLQAYKYYSKVVPTVYEKLGMIIDTNQYSLTEQHNVYKINRYNQVEGIPGIFFKYEFEPIKLVISEKRIPFIQFVSRLATIIGGLLIVAGYLYRLYEKLLTILFGKRYTERDTEKLRGGLLDRDSTKMKRDY